MAIAHGKHERRGAEGGMVRGGGIPLPSGRGVWGGGIPLPGGGGLWEGGSAPSPENFCNPLFQMVHFHAIWRMYFHVGRCVKTSKKQEFGTEILYSSSDKR